MRSATLIEKCCLIANPAAGNPTHYLVEQAFAQAGLDWRFMTFEVEPAQLGDAMRGIRALGFHGVKVGEPFNEAVIEHLDEVSDVARQVRIGQLRDAPTASGWWATTRKAPRWSSCCSSTSIRLGRGR